MPTLQPGQFTHLSTYLIAEEASSRGIKVEKIITTGHYAKTSLMCLRYKKREEYIVGQRISEGSVIGYWLQKNKYYAKIFFRKAGLSVAEGEIFSAKYAHEIRAYARKIGYPVVVKPIGGIQGKDVFVGITTPAILSETLDMFRGKALLVEKHFEGEEYRLFATRNKLVAATKRIPANVTGDGIHTIKELIAIKNRDPRRGTGHEKSLVVIRVDKVVQAYLRKIKRELSDIPKKGERVFLRENSSISTGGDSIDVTSHVHPDVKKIAVRAVQAIPGLPYAGVDFLTNRDISKKPSQKSYIIIEVNDSPMISMHHFPYEGKRRNAAAAIVDILFPETKKRAR